MITVCIATFNGEKYIREQLNSILFQLSLQDEVIVSDDGSTDNTISIIKSFNDNRIKIIDGVHRHSPTLNFENALKEAKGDYIFLADQDDVWKDDKVKICLKWLQHYDCIISDAEVTDENLKITSPSLYQLMNIKSGRVYNILYKNGYTGCCMAFTRRVKEAALPFPKDIPMHDIWIGNVAAFLYKVKFIDDKLIYFRRHSLTISCNGKGSRYSLYKRLMFRVSIVKNIILLIYTQNKRINNSLNMNIVYIIEDYSENGGVEKIVSMKANTFYQEYHHQVTVISIYEDKRKQQYSLNEDIRLIHLHVPFAKKTRNKVYKLLSRIITLLLAAYRLNKTIKQINPDVVFFTTTLGALLLPLCHTKARRIYESHLARSFNPFHLLFGLMERKADAIVCLTHDDAKEFQSAKNVYVIPNFINIPHQKVKDYSCKKAIAVGRLEQQKGFDRLITCWKDVAKLYPDWQLDIYGTGSLYHILQEQITSLGLEKQVKLCGRGENMMEIYPNYSLHVMSSHYEGQGIVMLEAQACGLPSVTFDFKYGANEIIRDEINGIIARQNDNEAFITAICKMINSESLRHNLGMKAQTMAIQYSKFNIFQKWLELLRCYT